MDSPDKLSKLKYVLVDRVNLIYLIKIVIFFIFINAESYTLS